ncbi:Blastoderm-specific protein 25D, partial [Eumeta japonica]
MEFSGDPYEYKLYQMFQSCDTSQCGYLDENSLRRLCAQLELRDKGAVLIENLAREERTSHVTFENFKEALLNFLGTEIDGANTHDLSVEPRKDQIVKRINDKDKTCN